MMVMVMVVMFYIYFYFYFPFFLSLQRKGNYMQCDYMYAGQCEWREMLAIDGLE